MFIALSLLLSPLLTDSKEFSARAPTSSREILHNTTASFHSQSKMMCPCKYYLFLPSENEVLEAVDGNKLLLGSDERVKC